MDFWRKLTMLLSAVSMAFVLTACGGPSKSDAGDFVLEIAEGLYDGDIDPMLDAMAIDELNIEDEIMARRAAKGKAQQLLDAIKAKADSHGGVDDIEIVDVQQRDELFRVTFQVIYEDGTVEKQATTVGWIEEADRFWILE